MAVLIKAAVESVCAAGTEKATTRRKSIYQATIYKSLVLSSLSASCLSPPGVRLWTGAGGCAQGGKKKGITHTHLSIDEPRTLLST